MDVIRGLITIAVGIISLIAGRYWGLHDRKIAKDKETLNDLQKILTLDIMLYMKEHDFGGAVLNTNIDRLYDFCYKCKDPSFFFLNSKMENLRSELCEKVQDFAETLSLESFPMRNQEYNKIPAPEEFQDDGAWLELRSRLNNMSVGLYNIYTSLMKLAKEKLL